MLKTTPAVVPLDTAAESCRCLILHNTLSREAPDVIPLLTALLLLGILYFVLY